MELPLDRVDLTDRPETDSGLELYRGVGGWSSTSLLLARLDDVFSDIGVD